MKTKVTLYAASFIVALFILTNTATSQCIDCGTGTDGAFLATTNTTLAGGTYNFTSFIINAGVTVSITGNVPLDIRSTGAVDIQGTLTASGGNGANGITFSTFGMGGVGVAGGANGGDGVYIGSPSPGIAGFGTGAGGGGAGWSGGGGGGYAANGLNSGGVGGFGGISYGNVQINPIVAGSGGGGGSGGNSCGSGGGGAGGGVISISTCSSFTIGVSGNVLCNGGNGGTDGGGNCGGGGGGSGGSIWFIANNINNLGTVSAVGGVGGTTTIPNTPYWGNGGAGSLGRTRLDYFSYTGTGVVAPAIGYTEVPSTLAVTQSVTNATCNSVCDGSLSVTVLNGTPPYTYLWSTGCTTQNCASACAGNYTVTVSDGNGCTTISTTTVMQPTPVSVSASPQPTICANHCITLAATASGGNGTPYLYSWSPSVPQGQNPDVCPTDTITYTCLVTDSLGCTGSDSVTVYVLPLPVLTLSAQDDTVCINSGINILFGAPSGGNYFGTGVGGNNFNASLAGAGAHAVNYRYTGSNGCSDTITIFIVVDLCTGVDAITGDAGVSVYPNPATSQLIIESGLLTIESIEVYDVVGRNASPLTHLQRQGEVTSIDISELAPGIYFINLKTEKGIAVKKISKI